MPLGAMRVAEQRRPLGHGAWRYSNRVPDAATAAGFLLTESVQLGGLTVDTAMVH